MSSRRAMLMAVLVASLAGCGAKPSETGQPSPGAMPAGGQWRGSYQGPYHIALNIWTEGTKAVGNWRAVGEREGEFAGTVFGNMLILNFSEHGAKNAERYSGRGYFVYSVPEAGKPHQIYGEWGVGKTGATSPWWAIKRADDPIGKHAPGLVDRDADDQYQDDTPGCEGGNCDSTDNEQQ